jgi:hypothetical protein
MSLRTLPANDTNSDPLPRHNQDNVAFQTVGAVGVIWKRRAVARRLGASMLR